MSTDKEEALARWRAQTRSAGFAHRRWRSMRWAAGICAALLVAGLGLDLANGPNPLVLACWVGAGVAMGVTLALGFWPRLFAPRPPSSSPQESEDASSG